MTLSDSLDLTSTKGTTKTIVKKLHNVDGKTFVIIDKNIVQRLGLDNDGIWCEQALVDGGLYLKVVRKEN